MLGEEKAGRAVRALAGSKIGTVANLLAPGTRSHIRGFYFSC